MSYDPDTRLFRFLVVVWLIACTALLSLVCAHLNDRVKPRGNSAHWTPYSNGVSWSCTDDGQALLRDDASGSIMPGKASLCDSAG